MTDQEFDILDELYFVKTLAELQKDLSYIEDLEVNLESMMLKGWVKMLDEMDNELITSHQIVQENRLKHRFIATKQGLMAHNQV